MRIERDMFISYGGGVVMISHKTYQIDGANTDPYLGTFATPFRCRVTRSGGYETFSMLWKRRSG